MPHLPTQTHTSLGDTGSGLFQKIVDSYTKTITGGGTTPIYTAAPAYTASPTASPTYIASPTVYTASPTNTASPTYTASPTFTASPTYTASPSKTLGTGLLVNALGGTSGGGNALGTAETYIANALGGGTTTTGTKTAVGTGLLASQFAQGYQSGKAAGGASGRRQA